MTASHASYPTAGASGGDLQSLTDWCASAIALNRAAIASSMAIVHTWLMQSEWLGGGGMMASYPLPIASGPAIALTLQGTPTSQASAPSSPSVMFQ